MADWLARALALLDDTTPVQKVQLVQKGGSTDPNRTKNPNCIGPDTVERSASVDSTGRPSVWIKGFAQLRTVDHVPGFSIAQWSQLLAATAAFLDRWGSEAARLGWNEIDLLGCVQSLNGRGQPLRQVGQRIGLVTMIRDGEVAEITADRATIRYASGSELVYLRRPDRFRGTVALWDLIE